MSTKMLKVLLYFHKCPVQISEHHFVLPFTTDFKLSKLTSMSCRFVELQYPLDYHTYEPGGPDFCN